MTEYSKGKVKFAKKEGFECLEISVMPGTALDIRKLTKKEIEKINEVFTQNKIEIFYLACCVNHLDPDANKHRENNQYFIDVLEFSKEAAFANWQGKIVIILLRKFQQKLSKMLCCGHNQCF